MVLSLRRNYGCHVTFKSRWHHLGNVITIPLATRRDGGGMGAALSVLGLGWGGGGLILWGGCGIEAAVRAAILFPVVVVC